MTPGESEFHYRIPWRSSHSHPGYHQSNQTGGGVDFQGHEPLLSHPDPRNLDIRASLLDPFERYVVRSFRQRSSIPIQIVADLSASMTVPLARQKIDMLIEFIQATALSAYRTGDPFAFYAAADHLLSEIEIPLRWHRSLDQNILAKIRALKTEKQTAKGVLSVSSRLGSQRSLVFLVSDFHFEEAHIHRLMESLAPHDVVPIVLWSTAEYEKLPSHGLLRITDPETGKERTLLMRPTLRKKWQEAFDLRRTRLKNYFTLRGREPFFLIDQLDVDQLTQYFCQE